MVRWLEDHNGAQAQTEDTRETVYKFLEQQLKITNGNKRISKASVLRKTEKWKLASDQIIARKFLRYGDKELVMDQARKHLEDTDFHVYDDIPKLLYDSRKVQMKKLAKIEGKKLYRLL